MLHTARQDTCATYLCITCALQEGILTSSTYDKEFTEVFVMKPRRYAVSMLRSQREEVLQTLRANSQKSTAAVESAAAAVSAAKLDFLEAGLKSDWETATQMKGALAILKDENHLWQVSWLKEQEPL